jgi:hypothetical protein
MTPINYCFSLQQHKNAFLDKPECRKCAKALQELENIDDEADQLGIGFVKIHDELLADEYNLGDLPRLVYYRHKTPIIYEREHFFFLQKKNIFLTPEIFRRTVT